MQYRMSNYTYDILSTLPTTLYTTSYVWTYDIVYDIIKTWVFTHDIVGFGLFLPLAPTMSYTMPYTTLYVTTYDIVYDMIKICDIVGFGLRYSRFLDCSCQSYVRCDVRRRIRYRRFPTTICMCRIGIIRCRRYNTMS